MRHTQDGEEDDIRAGLFQTMLFVVERKKGVQERLLTRFPDALWRMQRITEDALVPQASKTMNHLSGLVQDHALHLVLTVV